MANYSQVLKLTKSKFDGRQMIAAHEKDVNKLLARVGAYTRTVARRSMKKAPKAAKTRHGQQKTYQRGKRKGQSYSQKGRYSALGSPPHYRSPEPNLRTMFIAIIERAGHEAWPKLFQNLRASRETELLALYPAKDVSSWLGNSVPVAMKHYAMARKEVFEDTALKPSGVMPENADKKSEAESEADPSDREWTARAKEKPAKRLVLRGLVQWAIQNSNL